MTTTSPKLKIINNHAYANSLDLARHFRKNHQHVLRSIDDILHTILMADASKIGHISSNFPLTNFIESTYTDSQNRQQRIYKLTRDAFALVAMGFTGERALLWKIAYIQAFNQLEAELNNRIIKDKHFGQLKFHFPDAGETIEESLPFMTVSYAVARLTELGLMIPPVSRQQIIGLIKRGTLAGFKNDQGWNIYAESFNRFIKMRRGQFV